MHWSLALSATSIVEIRELTKRFTGLGRNSTVLALNNINLDVAEGEFVALLGPSGCGKTTLLRILGGQEVATSGLVQIDGQDMSGVAPERRPVNMVFQTSALFPHLNVFDNIAFGPRIRRVPEQELRTRVAEVLELVRLAGYERRATTQLSGGQAQRIALARALINRPRVLLLDEPLSALDLNLRKAMQVELKEIHRRLGTTFIYVTHDQEEASAMADRIVIMQHGNVVQAGTPLDIYHHPVSVFASKFIGDSNVLAGRVVEVDPSHTIVEVKGCRIAGPAVSGCTVGEDLFVAVRPERVVLAALGSALPNAIPGRIADATFLGALVRYQIDIGDGVVVASTVSYQDETQLWAVDAPVAVGWEPRHSMLLAQ